jgi:AraC-like DNA-binding protein
MEDRNAKLLSKSNLNGNEIYFVISEIEKEYPLHFHEFYEIELPIEGEGYELINGIRHDISKDKIFMFHPTDYHQIFATKPLKIINIAFTDSLIDEEIISNFLNYDSGIVVELSPNKLKQILATCEVIKSIFFSNRTNKELILTHLLNALLLIIIGSNSICINKGSGGEVGLNLLKYIHANFARNPTLQELSDYCGYQKNYFCDFFKRLTGVTYKQYLSDIKINYSKKLLKTTSIYIKEIALECGFNSANNYIRKFKSYTDITPKDYRKMYYETKK